MNGRVFLDTNGWLALLNASERLHSDAIQRWVELVRRGNRIVLTDWVIAETGNGLSRSGQKLQFVNVVEQMMDAPSVEIISVDRGLLRRALSDYSKYTDKSWGLVDCASFIVMQDRGITEAFTSDRDFQQAGFTCLLSV
jgi:predicted nucleic acid-binding protein